MRILSVRPPYAQAIFDAGKNVENRSWSTTYRGLIYIHCSLKVNKDFFNCNGLAKSTSAVRKRMIQNFEAGKCVGGTILGSVDLVDVTQSSRSIWAIPGQYHWLLRNATRLKREVACTGKLGLCAVDSVLAVRLRKAA